jgi:hypothetical protein
LHAGFCSGLQNARESGFQKIDKLLIYIDFMAFEKLAQPLQ